MKTLLWIALALAILIAVPVAVFAAGVTGVLFHVWPTSWPDQQLRIGDEQLAALRELRAQSKFHEYMAPPMHYPGAPNDAVRLEAQALVDGIIDELVATLPRQPRKSQVLATFKRRIAPAQFWDTEERERIAAYLDEIMTVAGMNGSNDLINVWLRGLPYNLLSRLFGR